MRATHRIKNSKGETIGFLSNNIVYSLVKVRDNINSFENLKVRKDGVVYSDKILPEITKRQVNKKLYKEKCKKNPFERDIQQDLLNWKNEKICKHVLYLQGCRQVGKTTELLKFGYKHYENVIYVNLIEDLDLFKSSLSGQINPLGMSVYCYEKNLLDYEDSKTTLLIIDEIQKDSTVYNMIRFLDQNLSCDIIVTGSYLAHTLNPDYFKPMGNINYLKMFPMSFAEFCGVFGSKEELLESPLTFDITNVKDRETYFKLNKIYDLYRKIGGFPEVVQTYTKSKDEGRCYYVIGTLLQTFKIESMSYLPDIQSVSAFDEVFKQSILEMIKDKKGTGGDIIESFTQNIKNINDKVIVNKGEIRSTVKWLIETQIINTAGLYLNGNTSEYLSNRRLYFTDCGLVSYLGQNMDIPKSNLEGLITETFTFNELSRLFTPPLFEQSLLFEETPSFSTLEGYELDFMITSKKGKKYGIEVKTTDSKHKSLNYYLSKRKIDKGIYAKRSAGENSEHFLILPIFKVGVGFPYEL